MFLTVLLRANQIFKKEMLKQCIFKKVNFIKSSERFRFSRIIVPYLFKLQRLKCNITYFPRTWCHKTFHFTVLFQTATFEIQRLKCNGACFPRIIFPYFFKPQRLKCNVTCFQRIMFSYFFKNKSSFTNRNVWRYNVLLISLKCLHYRYKFLLNFIDNAAYRFHYTYNNENSCTISFI